MDYYRIGQRIRTFRKARGLSQDQLAERVGISTTHMSHIETGNTKLSLPVLVELAAVLEVRTDDLLHDGHPTDHTALSEEILSILADCPTRHLKIMIDLLRASKKSLDMHF